VVLTRVSTRNIALGGRCISERRNAYLSDCKVRSRAPVFKECRHMQHIARLLRRLLRAKIAFVSNDFSLALCCQLDEAGIV